MRKQDTLFDHFCTFINYLGEGANYTTKELISNVGIHESPTRWKQWSMNEHYTTRGYQSLLRKGGFLENTKRGHWKILRAVPDWFTLPHLMTLVGYTHNTVSYPVGGGKYEWRQVPRTDMTQQEISDKLNGIVPKLRAAAESYKEEQRLDKLETAMQIAFNSTYGAFHGTHAYTSTSTKEDPMYYASGAYAQEKDESRNAVKVETFTPEMEEFTPYTATVEKIEASDSTFYQQPEQWKYGQQLQENLMLNAGYINSSLAVLDQADFLDPVMHARVVNIMVQLKDLQRTIDERIEYKRNKQTI